MVDDADGVLERGGGRGHVLDVLRHRRKAPSAQTVRRLVWVGAHLLEDEVDDVVAVVGNRGLITVCGEHGLVVSFGFDTQQIAQRGCYPARCWSSRRCGVAPHIP
eukprot:1701703-Rhodomonas_salina.2